MLTSVLDTSVLVRYLTNDDSTKAASVHALLQAASDASLLVPNVAVAELAFVLLRVYRWPAMKVADALRAVVNHRAIDVPGQEIWLHVADDIERGGGVIDAYLVRTAEHAGIEQVLTFDDGMKPLPIVRCIAP
jgi:predicted nucleic acid-binding protein